MKWLNFYSSELDCHTKSQVFEYLLNNLKPSSTTWDYFVDWQKVQTQMKSLEHPLHLLNSLVGKPLDQFDTAFKNLVSKYPEVVAVIPALIACRPDKFPAFKILDFDQISGSLDYQDFTFKKTDQKLPAQLVEDYLMFIDKVGLKKLMTNGSIKSLSDYMFGVETGLNTNARKNRSGKIMEIIVAGFLDELVKQQPDIKYIDQVTKAKFKKEFGYNLPDELAKSRHDFALQAKSKLFLVEANFYNGNGSKLKSTAGEYLDLNQRLKQAGHNLIWITDGPGWKQSRQPLKQAFDSIDYIFNLDMLQKGVLSSVVLYSDCDGSDMPLSGGP